MPSLSKKTLSLFIRNGCERQCVFSLYGNKEEREKFHLPPPQTSRAALGLVGQQGYDWQDEKVSELKSVFGEENVHMNPVPRGSKRKRPGQLDLLVTLPKTKDFQFIVEADYQPDTSVFRAAIGFTNLTDYFGNPVSIGNTHPDIVQILPSFFSGNPKQMVDDKRNPYKLAVKPNGDTSVLAPDDKRLRLRIIDVKLASEPGAHYFAEVVYYSITLAGWLVEHKLDHLYVVVAAPAVWPGSHEASNLSTQFADWKKKGYEPSSIDVSLALEEDLEIAPFDVFAPRLRRFFTEELPSMLSKPWQELNWHVDFRCKGCEFLGYPWLDKDGNIDNDPSQCWPMAEATDHLSQVFGLSRGASEQLRVKNIVNTTELADTRADSSVFDDHQGLRAKRTTYPYRAKSLKQKSTEIIPNSGGDALMPKWPDLHVYVFLDYDLSTAITASIAVRAFWLEPLPYQSQILREQKHRKQWTQKSGEDEVFLIDTSTLERERAEFLKFLSHLKKIMGEVIHHDDEDTKDGRRDSKTEHSTYQIYLWDESQRKHLVRLISRHLPYILADPQIRSLAWLFPPPELLQNPDDATRQSPITLLSNVVNNTVAVPIPHHYRLIDVVNTLKPQDSVAPSIHPLYQEPMSDLIPAERIHEWWKRLGDWNSKQTAIRNTTQKKALALNLVSSRLENDLKMFLSSQAAPRLVRQPRDLRGIAPQSHLWLEFTRLNAAIDSLEIHTTRSLPPHEREARLKSARLTRRLTDQEEAQVLAQLSLSTGKKLLPANDLFTYKISDDSREVNVRPGDFLYALAPENRYGFLDEHPFRYTRNTSFQNQVFRSTIADAGMTAVSVEAIDRVNCFIVLRASHDNRIRLLEKETELDFSENVILDPTHKDYLTDKIELTVKGIGNPPIAITDQRTLQALGLSPGTPPGTSNLTPAAEILWEASKMRAQLVNRKNITLRNQLQAFFDKNNGGLDKSQWTAWEGALSHRLSLIWGPPGTGKSHTLGAIVLGAILDALQQKQTIRLLITANTYTGVDNVLLDLERELKKLLPEKPYEICRVQSKWRPVEPDLTAKYPDLRNLVLNTMQPSTEIKDLRKRLDNPSDILIVGCPPQQLHNLAIANKQKRSRRPEHTIQSWFDFIILDEASQMDVASSTLVFSKLTPNGSCVLAGDDLQLPPVQQAEPPQDLEFLVGSAYNYFRHQHKISPYSLDINYRSNSTIVEFTKLAGYSANLESFSPELKLHLPTDIPTNKPAGWPQELCWSPNWSKFLDPSYPAVCFVYDDRLSSQINDFEADSTAALLWLLNSYLGNRLENENRLGGVDKPIEPASLYNPKEFWDEAVGVVAPHRVQMSKIIYRLQSIFKTHSPENIRNAVDTVERFQGQQRSVIIGSFGLGDPDIISTEEEFLYNLNRFNVLTSRARAKIILFITRSLLDHLSNDGKVLNESRLVKQFAESFCNLSEQIQIDFLKQNRPESRFGLLRRNYMTLDQRG